MFGRPSLAAETVRAAAIDGSDSARHTVAAIAAMQKLRTMQQDGTVCVTQCQTRVTVALMSAIDRLTRRTLPSAVIALSQVDGAARIGAKARRRTGRRGQVELYFAFDDAASAVAVIGVAERVAGRDVRLVL